MKKFVKSYKDFLGDTINESNYSDISPMNTEYDRIIPRDLFNEAKLLKCVALLCLKIHDNETPIPMTFNENLGKFKIGIYDDGYLGIENINLAISGNIYLFRTVYNDKSNFPFYVTDYENNEYLVFNENGQFTSDFIEFAESVNEQ